MDDLISRQTALDALARMMPRSYTPDGSHPADEEIFRAQEIYVDCIESIEILPAVQPDHIADSGKKAERTAETAQNVKDGDSVFRQAAIDCVTYDVEHTIECLKALPSAQPEIIRCKDCKHYLHDEEYGFDWCNRMSGVFRAKPDGFCSWAVMRGGGTE